VCTPHERDRLAVLDPCAQQREFLVMWTLKEAWLKRRHEGMTPGRLAHVETRPTAAAAEGRVWQRDDATLAVVAGAHTSLHWHRDVLGLAGEPSAAWHVTSV
jgi:4'-phosphopantetheinyl transferase